MLTADLKDCPVLEAIDWKLSLYSRLKEMVLAAEGLFGEAIGAYIFLGIEFHDNDRPQLHIDEEKYATIKLPLKSYADPYHAENECAHEMIHLLFHSPGLDETNLEEGVATYFQDLFLREVYHSGLNPSYLEYSEPFQLVSELLNMDRAAIKKLRGKEPILSLITKEIIFEVFPDLDPRNAEKLVMKFPKT